MKKANCFMVTMVTATVMMLSVPVNASAKSTGNSSTYSITYNLKGGHANNPRTYTRNSEIKLNDPKKKGYVFIGWTGTGLKKMKRKVTIKKGMTGNRYYTANWAKKKYKVKFDTGCDAKVKSITVGYDEKFRLPSCPVSNGKYMFAGWTDGKTVYKAGEKVRRLTTNGKIRLKAKWKKGKSLGVWRVTAYEPTGVTASGVPVTPHRSVAMARNAMEKYGLEFGDLIYLPTSDEVLVLEDWGDSLMAARCEWIDVCVDWDEIYSDPYNTETRIYLVS